MAYLKGVDLSGSSDISGSIGIFGNVTGSSFTGSFTGSYLGDLVGTVSTASYVDYSNIDNKPTLISSSTQIASDISGAFTADSASFSTRVTDLETFSSSLDNTFATEAELNAATASLSSSLATDIATKANSASFAIDIATLDSTTVKLTGNQSIAGTKTFTEDILVQGTASINYLKTIYETSSVIYSSGSTKFGDTLDDTHVRTGSLLITGSSYTINGEDIIITSALNAATSSLSSSLATDIALDSASLAASITTNSASAASDIAALIIDSGSFSTRVTTNETEIDALQTDSGSFSTRVTDLETFSSSLDDTFATEAELNAATASLSSSLAIDIATKANSASFATDIASLVIDSASFSTRVTANESFSSSLSSTIISYTGSFSGDGSNLTGVVAAGTISSSAQIASDISGAFTDASASLAASITTNSASAASDIAALVTDSGSFSTRVTDLETFSSSLDATFATEAELNTATASLSASLAIDIATNSASIASVESFPYTGSAIISGSLNVIGDLLQNGAAIETDPFPYTGSAIVSGSLNVIGDLLQNGAAIETDPFPYTGSAIVSGSLIVTGSIYSDSQVYATASHAVSASYAPNTGVTSITAGSGITINQSTGDITISSETIVGGSIATGSFTDVLETSLIHNFGSTNILVAVYDSNGNEIIPATITLDSDNQTTATFASTQTGTIVVIEAQSGEYATTQFTNTGSITLNHSLGTQNLNVVAYDSNDAQFYPDIDILDSSNVKATFASPSTGTLLAVVREGTVSSSFSNTVDTTITHNLSSSAVIASVYDTSYNKIIPSEVSIVDTSSINLTFATTSSGNIVIVGGPIDTTSVTTATSFTQVITGASSYTVDHNLNSEWPLVQVYESSSRAQYIPQSIVSVNANSVQLTFSTTFDGVVSINS